MGACQTRPGAADGKESTGKPQLLYFQFTGRAEICRIALFAAFGSEWENLTIGNFKAEKAKFLAGDASSLLAGGTGSVPLLKLPNGQTVSQSMSIARYAGVVAANAKRKAQNGCDLYPISEPEKVILVDEVMSHAEEVLGKTPQDADAEVKKQKRLEFANEGYMKKALTLIESRYQVDGSGDFLFGKDLTLADVAMAGFATAIAGGTLDHIEPSYLDNFPNIKKLPAAVEAHPFIVRYKKQCPPFTPAA